MNKSREIALIYFMAGLAVFTIAVGVAAINQDNWNISSQVVYILLAVECFGGLIFGFLWRRGK